MSKKVEILKILVTDGLTKKEDILKITKWNETTFQYARKKLQNIDSDLAKCLYPKKEKHIFAEKKRLPPKRKVPLNYNELKIAL